jgi:hypothetical protein
MNVKHSKRMNPVLKLQFDWIPLMHFQQAVGSRIVAVRRGPARVLMQAGGMHNNPPQKPEEVQRKLRAVGLGQSTGGTKEGVSA